jgi:hypothetical protein
MRASPDHAILALFVKRATDTLLTIAVSEAELRTGAAILPAGQRRDWLVDTIVVMIAQDCAGHILPFDSPAARCFADGAAARRFAGKPIMDADCQIAAISCACGVGIAMRNVKAFEGCGIEVINPWNAV